MLQRWRPQLSKRLLKKSKNPKFKLTLHRRLLLKPKKISRRPSKKLLKWRVSPPPSKWCRILFKSKVFKMSRNLMMLKLKLKRDRLLYPTSRLLARWVRMKFSTTASRRKKRTQLRRMTKTILQMQTMTQLNQSKIPTRSLETQPWKWSIMCP